MSVSLCVFRLEISRDYPGLNHLRYTAPKLGKKFMSNHTSTQTDPDDEFGPLGDDSLPPRTDEIIQANLDSSCSSDMAAATEPNPKKQELFKQHRGSRELVDITVETYCQTGNYPSSKLKAHPGSSKEASPAPLDKLHPGEKKNIQRILNQIGFYSGNPFVETTKGILHMYKENEMTSLKDDVPRSEMLCMLSVPASVSVHDLLQFLAPCCGDMEHIRIVRNATPNQYMVLIKFRHQESADQFYSAFNGVRFNSFDPEVCHLVYVSKVETTKELEVGGFPMERHTELPTCPVCLERMDESVDGILTILCNHSFHGSCLAKWGDTSCPVCRYCQTPEPVADNRCFQCHSQESLWICLICGHIGCGRYVEGHAYNHFLDTQHTFAMQLGNNRVWDYAGDNYVHRLVQNKTDGKLVELDENNRATVESEEKVDSIQLEYTYLLTSQLESQRAYFEDKLARFEEDTHRQVDELKERTKQSVEECKDLKEKVTNMHRDKQNQERKLQQLQSKLNKTTTELKEEREMNKCLRQNQMIWTNKVKELESQIKDTSEEKEKEVGDLKEQLRDVMFFLEAQNQLQKVPEEMKHEIQEGQIVLPVEAQAAASSTSTRHRRKKTR